MARKRTPHGAYSSATALRRGFEGTTWGPWLRVTSRTVAGGASAAGTVCSAPSVSGSVNAGALSPSVSMSAQRTTQREHPRGGLPHAGAEAAVGAGALEQRPIDADPGAAARGEHDVVAGGDRAHGRLLERAGGAYRGRLHRVGHDDA